MNVELESHGLKCDNPKCDWHDSSILFSDYKQWLNVPCPKCGENVLTESDFKNAEALRKAIDIVNSMSPEELEELNALVKESGMDIKNHPMMKGAIGIDTLNLNEGGPVIAKVDTHGEVKVTVIKNDGKTANN